MVASVPHVRIVLTPIDFTSGMYRPASATDGPQVRPFTVYGAPSTVSCQAPWEPVTFTTLPAAWAVGTGRAAAAAARTPATARRAVVRPRGRAGRRERDVIMGEKLLTGVAVRVGLPEYGIAWRALSLMGAVHP
ncbi:hypothetical protein GCM10010264_14260 [Streptomyces globisporus]|nr:hypothetical protein GCM10010264_14260 [Streptomyces globisporus]